LTFELLGPGLTSERRRASIAAVAEEGKRHNRSPSAKALSPTNLLNPMFSPDSFSMPCLTN
jgi:hypothetical protein